jgi:small-conductance mechanosensitive channel
MSEIPIRNKLVMFLSLIASVSLLLFVLPLIETTFWGYLGQIYGIIVANDGTIVRTQEQTSEMFGLTLASLISSLFKILRIIFWMALVILAVRLTWFVIFTTALRAASQSEIASLVKTVLSIVVYIVSFFVIFQTQYPNVPLAPLFTGSTIIGIVVGLALQDTLGNLFAGIALQADQPFQVGDIVAISNRGMGTVESVTWRGVKIRTFQNRLLVISNSVLGKETIEVAPRDNLNARIVTFNTLYSDSPVKTMNVIRSAISDVDNVAKRPRPIVRIGGFGDSGIDWEIKYWCEDYKRHPETDAAIRQRIWYAFNREDIQFAYPTRTVYIERQREQKTDSEAVDAVAEHLRSVDIFSSLSEKDIQRIALNSHVQVYAPGE